MENNQNISSPHAGTDGGKGSVLDTKETLEHFSSDFLISSQSNQGSQEHLKSYLLTRSRYINLRVADALDSHKESFNSEINKQVRRLRFCSSIVVQENQWHGEIKVAKTSKRCKSSHCSICRRARSGKLAARLKAAINDEDNKPLFENRRFYFLTLTVKHDKTVRNYNYFKEFKGYITKLRRRKCWKSNFDGAVISIENVISDQYHIHGHCLLCGLLKGKVNDIQKEIQSNWMKITKDSYQCRLDLIKSSNIDKAIIEVLKYSTKVSNINDLTGRKLDLYVDWIKKSKGQNFVNVSGVFKGLELTSNKSKYDTPRLPTDISDNSVFYLGRSIKNKFNFSHKKRYTEIGKKHLKQRIYQKEVDPEGLLMNPELATIAIFQMGTDFNNENLEVLVNELKSYTSDDDDFDGFDTSIYEDSEI